MLKKYNPANNPIITKYAYEVSLCESWKFNLNRIPFIGKCKNMKSEYPINMYKNISAKRATLIELGSKSE